MNRKAGECRTFTPQEQQWTRAHWYTTKSLEAMAAHLRCRIPVLKREAKLMGLAPRTLVIRKPKASELRSKRTYHKHCERVKDVDGERSSPPPEGIRYSCPGCGMRALTPVGHLGCVQAA